MSYVAAAMAVYNMYSGVASSKRAEKARKRANEKQALYQASQDQKRADNVLIQKKDMFDSADEDELKVQNSVAKMVGSQRANLAARGIEIDSDIGGMIQEETRRFGREDISTIKDNAQRAAWGMDNEIEQLHERANQAILDGQAVSSDIARAGRYEREGIRANAVGSIFNSLSSQEKQEQQGLKFNA